MRPFWFKSVTQYARDVRDRCVANIIAREVTVGRPVQEWRRRMVLT